MENINNQMIPDPVVQQTLEKLNEAYDLIRPYLHTLSNDERAATLKMGDKSLALVEKTVELATTNPELAPKYFNLEDLNIDLSDAVKLRTLLNRAQQITRDLDDTMMLAGHEAIAQSLSFYNSAKQAARDNVPGAQTVFNELKKRFAVGRPKKGTATESITA
ncbi:MAG: hypothetical protein LBS09_05960 [Bacteroidales bacterium]|jgi:hypothetical protein|nr:hypothetical protein [Bacteroidales bacterium]